MRRLPPGSPILTAEVMRDAEARAFARGISQDSLMERAGLAVARTARRLGHALPFVVLAGPGNNGGDGYVAARILAGWGHDVIVIALGVPRTGAAARMAALWSGATISWSALVDADVPQRYVLIDGLFGIGPQRPINPDERQRDLLSLADLRIAIDIPSGIDADTGTTISTFPGPVVTIALGALKPAHVVADCGDVLLDDLGLGDDIAAARTASGQAWTSLGPPAGTLRPAADAHKYRLHVVIVSGAMPGAARLAARGAVGAGAGYVTVLGDPAGQGPFDAVVHRSLDVLPDILLRGDVRLVVGPGLGRDDRARRIVDTAIAADCMLVLDGDALTLLGNTATDRLRNRSRAVLTPHAAEFARMFGDGGGDKIARTVAAADAIGSTIVHKGATTVIARDRGRVSISTDGSPWLATAGTGDVLAGAIAARGDADAGVWIHARASQLAGAAYCADRLADHLPHAMAECT